MSYAKDKKNPPKPEKNRQSFVETEFVNYKLTETEADDFTSNYDASKFNVLSALTEMVTNHYKVTISPDFENSCYIVSVTGTTNSLNPHRCMTSRSDDLGEAVAIALYKLENVFKWEFWEVSQQRRLWG